MLSEELEREINEILEKAYAEEKPKISTWEIIRFGLVVIFAIVLVWACCWIAFRSCC